MERRIIALIALVGIMTLLMTDLPAPWVVPGAGATLSLGFLLLSAHLIAVLLTRFGLPKITGYILAGMLFGPSVTGLLANETLTDLKLVDDLALTFIAFAAGGELRMNTLKERNKSILFTLLCLITMVLAGVTLSILAFRSVFPLTAGRPFLEALAVALILGVISVARSPSSAIAIISETKASGPFTDTVLAVTVAADVLTIFLFAIVLSISQLLMSTGQGLDLTFLAGIGIEVTASLLVGFLLSLGIAYYLKNVRAEHTIFVLGVAFLVTKFSHSLAWTLEDQLDMRFHLEPMLICMTAGFFVQNRSAQGNKFLRIIDRSALPIYAVFFALSGASLNLGALESTWHWALVLVALRFVFIYIGTYTGGRLADDPPVFQKASGLSFITQAGVSLGLAKLVAERFPGLGVQLSALVIATITINQIIGPITFKRALSLVGETKLHKSS
jgi:Kef-type K+ transport system membrane component KefB